MPDQAMLDVSMVVHRDSLNDLLGLAAAEGLQDLVIANSLAQMSEHPDQLLSTMSRFLGLRKQDTDLRALERLAPILIQQIPRFSVREMERPRLTPDFALAAPNMAVAELLHEEWLFLTSHSWMFARVRASFDRMVDAGAAALQVPRAHFEKLVRRTLKKPTGPLSPNDNALAAAKWLAVSGPPLWSLLEPVSGTVGSVVSGIFLLCDP